MSIQINGCTVIDNNRNFCNAANVNSTTVCTTTLYATNYCGSGISSLGGESYVCAIACTDLTAGDPVVTCCTVGVGSACGDPGFCCFICTCYTSPMTQASNDAVAVKFGCSDSCFAVVHFLSAIAAGCDKTGSPGPNILRDGCIHIRAFCASPTGSISAASTVCNYALLATCICNGCCCGVFQYTQAVDQLRNRKPIAISSNSGSKADVILCRYRCFQSCGSGSADWCCYETNHIKLCYCTATQAISVICFCCTTSTILCCDRTHFITPDNCYFVTVQNSMCANETCAAATFSLNVKLMKDTDCYLSYPDATVTGCAFKSVLPATCVNFNASSQVQTEIISPFTYGVDGWMPMWTTVFRTNADPYCVCTEQRIWAVKPTGDNTVCMSTNVINPCLSTCIPYAFNASIGCCSGSVGYGALARSWDQGDGVKRIMWVAEKCSPACIAYRLLCFNVTGGALTYLGLTDTAYCDTCCASCGYRQFQPACYNATDVKNSGAGGCGAGYNLALYTNILPIDHCTSCYLFTGTCGGLLGCSGGGACIYWQGSAGGSPNYNDEACASAQTFKYCIANTDPNAFTLTTNFRPIQNLTATYVSKKCICINVPCPRAYNYKPIRLQANTVVISATNGQLWPSQSYCQGACPATTYVISYTTTSCNNLCCFLGIAQNSVSAGGIACVAVPGMIDRSNTISRFFPTCTAVGTTIAIGVKCASTSPACCFAETQTMLGVGFGTGFVHYPCSMITFKRYCDCKSGNLTYISTRSGFIEG